MLQNDTEMVDGIYYWMPDDSFVELQTLVDDDGVEHVSMSVPGHGDLLRTWELTTFPTDEFRRIDDWAVEDPADYLYHHIRKKINRTEAPLDVAYAFEYTFIRNVDHHPGSDR